LTRLDGRRPDETRSVRITPGYLEYAEGSALIQIGGTAVLCVVSAGERVPPFLRGTGSGWVTAEYGMLPRSTRTRTPREALLGRPSGRTQEIQRLIGRSLRAIVNLDLLGEQSFIVDCDVIRADGGTRTAAITGAYVALKQAFQKLIDSGALPATPLKDAIAAVSLGIVDGIPLLDLSYEEDSRAEVDFNIAMTGSGEFVEVQASGESASFSRTAMEELLALAEKGIRELLDAQKTALEQTGQGPA
jgi:ribonuclease PH